MDEAQKDFSQSSETKNVLPDVVHSQQIPTLESVVEPSRDSDAHTHESHLNDVQDVEDVSATESISEHIPFRLECSVTESEPGASVSHGLLKVEQDSERLSKNSSLNIPSSHQKSSNSPNKPDTSPHSSWGLDANASDVHISEESPAILALSSDTSKEILKSKSPSPSTSNHETPQGSPRSEYIDSLNDNLTHKSNNSESDDAKEASDIFKAQSSEVEEQCSSGSEEIIKLDIRGQGAPKIPLETAKIFFGPPPEGSTIIGPTLESLPIFQKLLSPCLVSTSDGVIVEEVFEEKEFMEKVSLVKSQTPSENSGSDKIEQDVLVEEVIIEDDIKEKSYAATTPPKSFAPEDLSFNTMSTDYKTICEEYYAKLVHLEGAITHRDQLIEELTVSLQRSVQERDHLKHDNEHLTHEVLALQHAVAEGSPSDHDNIKAQLSDYIKYQTMIKDDSTKFYSALMSGTTSLQSSNGEKDMDREEITVNYSKSDLRSSGSSDDFQTGFETKLTILLNKYEGCIEKSVRNKLQESLIQVLGGEVGTMRVEHDTHLKELEAQLNQEKQVYNKETRKLWDLLASVKAGDVDIDELRQVLSIKHEKEMENLRTYFEQKCSDMERSYSEEVWRGRAGALDDAELAAGDGRRRSRSVDFPSLNLETSTPIDNTLKQTSKKLENQLEDLKAEHVAYINELQQRHKETIASLEEQITQLKAHIQTAENTEGNVSSLYQQDIDLELEKERDAARRQLLRDLHAQLQVLLSDPDAELSSWPLELVALRDRIHAEKPQDSESIRDEVPAGEADKWRQRRNCSFDQNRQLEEVTKERDELKLLAATLRRAVSQLVTYCSHAEDELNNTVLAKLLTLDDRERTLESSAEETWAGAVTVHLAPDLADVLPALGARLQQQQQQQDLSADIRRQLDRSLQRLRDEAHAILRLVAARTGNKEQDMKMLESSEVVLGITELEDTVDISTDCATCLLYQKSAEQAEGECAAVRGQLRAALDQLALLADAAPDDVIAEGYGAGGGRWAEPPSPRSQAAALQLELEAAHRDRDDAALQLEAANRQLRATRQFVEEQAAEREAERDEHAARVAELRADNARLLARLQASAALLAEVEQLETQTREMNHLIEDLETRKATADDERKANEEKTTLLRDIIANLENQLEQKTSREAEVLEQLEVMKNTIDDRDARMREMLQELETLREQSVASCGGNCEGDVRYKELLQQVEEQARRLERRVCGRAAAVGRAAASADCSERTEDVSQGERCLRSPDASAGEGDGGEGDGGEGDGGEGDGGEGDGGEGEGDGSECEDGGAAGAALARVWERLQALERAEDAALKRIADLHMQRRRLTDVAQEVRAERDVLQARMSEQALRVSSLAARLQRQRCDAEALAHCAASDLGVRLHDAHAEVQRLKEELEAKDKQLTRLKQSLEDRGKHNDQYQLLYGNSCAAKQRVSSLERELAQARDRAARLQARLRRAGALQLQDEEEEDSDIVEAKVSARTLSDIVSISEYDEQDQQMRRAELRHQNISLSPDFKDATNLNKTLPPDVHIPAMSSLNVNYADHHDNTDLTPRADSLPVHLTSTQNRETYKRNANETTVFGTIDKFGESVKHSTARSIPDNCSMYPNREVSDSKNVTVEPKKINFSLEPSYNKTEDEFTSLKELGVMLEVIPENYPEILSQLKHEVKKSKSELEVCKCELNNAKEQLGEFPTLKEEVEELKGVLENTMTTMANDKKFYENQLENFSSNKKLVERKLEELQQEAVEKSKDLDLLKEDILRRENMVLELAKEKRNLISKVAELEARVNDNQSRNSLFEKYEVENKQLKEKVFDLQKLEQMVSEKNQQIDSLNQHLDRLDDLQRCLNDKTEEIEKIKRALHTKTNELFQVRDSVATLNRDIAKVIEENDQLSYENKDLKLKLTKTEKEQENASLKLQNSESELGRLNSLNNDLKSRLDKLKNLNDKLKEKETEVEMLNEDINMYHSEVEALKELLQMVPRTPSPESNTEDRSPVERKAAVDRKQLVKMKKQVSLLQHELEFHKKDLNEKAFELARARLQLAELADARGRLREESDVIELKEKLREKMEKCQELEEELQNLREIVDSVSQRERIAGDSSRGLARSPTAELERAVRDQLDYSHALDDDIMGQILSASSDERDDIPRLALDTSNRSSSGGECPHAHRGTLQLQLDNLECRLRDKDALIDELNRVRAQLCAEAEAARLRLEAERDCSARLALLLDAHKDSADTLRNQDASMIEMLKRRLESAMKSELEVQQREQQLLRRLQQLERSQRAHGAPQQQDDLLLQEKEANARLLGEVSAARARLELEQRRGAELAAALEAARVQRRRDLDQLTQRCAALKSELAELRRLKHESCVEVARSRELAHAQSAAIIQLERRLAHCTAKSEIENEKSDLAREMSTLRRCLGDTPELLQGRAQQQQQKQQQEQDKEQVIRYLHGRWARLESWRKALVWQKRYLQRVVAGYTDLERQLRPAADTRPTGVKMFKCVAWAAVAAWRMGFLVRRREAVRALAAAAILPAAPAPAAPAPAAAHRHRHLMPPLPSTPPLLHLHDRLKAAPPSPPSPASPASPYVPGPPLAASALHHQTLAYRSGRGDAAVYLQRLDDVGRRLRDDT